MSSTSTALSGKSLNLAFFDVFTRLCFGPLPNSRFSYSEKTTSVKLMTGSPNSILICCWSCDTFFFSFKFSVFLFIFLLSLACLLCPTLSKLSRDTMFFSFCSVQYNFLQEYLIFVLIILFLICLSLLNVFAFKSINK